MPPSPWMASTRMAQTSLENFARRSATSLKRTNSTPGMTGIEGLAVLFFRRGGDGAHGAAVKAVVEGEELCADGAALSAEAASVGAGEFERGLPSFGAAVGKEDAIEARDFGEAEG